MEVNTDTDYFPSTSSGHRLTDALGSAVRDQLTSPTGNITYARAYDPYGVVTSTAGTTQTSYGYTDEFTSNEMVYLRARYYTPGTGRFLTRDTWMGDYNRPLSLNRWNYTNSNPINFVDPSGKTPSAGGDYPRYCQAMPTKVEYAKCVLDFFQLEYIDLLYTDIDNYVGGNRGCYVGPKEYRAPGYIEGLSLGESAVIAFAGGIEIVYDFATMQRREFIYTGMGYQLGLGVSDSAYLGIVNGFKTSVRDSDKQKYDIVSDYQGDFINTVIGGSIGDGFSFNFGVNIFMSPSDPLIRGTTYYIGGSMGVSFLPFSDFGQYKLYYTPWGAPTRNYLLGNGFVDLGRLQSDIRSGDLSPLRPISGAIGVIPIYRNHQANQAFKYAFAYNALRYQEILGW